MVTIMNDYVAKMQLLSDDVTKGILNAALQDDHHVVKSSIIIKSNKYIVDIKLDEFSVENAVRIMNLYMEKTRFHYSSYYIRFNEGDRVRYRYASCRENREGFYCDVVIS